jgi:hypothetical protein
VDLEARLAERGRALAEREARFVPELARARTLAESLHRTVSEALSAYHLETLAAPWLSVQIGPVTHDDKHLHAFEFDVRRGRHRAIVVIKSRGEATLVGPFHQGKQEGPCRRVQLGEATSASDELLGALGDLLDAFLDQATEPR